MAKRKKKKNEDRRKDPSLQSDVHEVGKRKKSQRIQRVNFEHLADMRKCRTS